MTNVIGSKDYEKVRKAILKLYDFKEKKIAAGWLAFLDLDPNPDNPDNWETLLYSKEQFAYVDLQHFPTIKITPGHTDSVIGSIKYKGDMKPKDVVKYIKNILDDK